MKTLQLVLKTLGDFFLDRNGDGDDKRFWGAVLIIVAIVYLFTRSGTDVWAVCGGLLTVATGLLWKASSADSKTPPAPPSNPTAGIPGS